MNKTTWYKTPIAVHPGETLDELLESMGLKQVEFAMRTWLSKETINRIIKWEMRITEESAIKFEYVLWIAANFWLNYQYQYDQDVARILEEKRLEEECNLVKSFHDYKVLVRYGYVKDTNIVLEKVQELLKFFQLNSLKLVTEELYPALHRQNDTDKINLFNLAVWKRLWEKQSEDITLKELNIPGLRRSIEEMRALTLKNISIASKELVNICANHGIALVYTDFFSKTYTGGAVRRLKNKSILIQIAPRFKTADSFWFTFFHELGHIFLHSKELDFTDSDNMEINKYELEADEFACNTLLPPEYLDEFEELKKILDTQKYVEEIKKFSRKVGVHAWIIAWRLARETWKWERLRFLLQRIKMSPDV